MSDSLYKWENGVAVPIDLETGSDPEYVERIEQLEEGQEELRTLIAQEVAKCLKLTGGELSGNISFSQTGDTTLNKSSAGARLIFRGGGSEFADGASLYLHGKNRTTDPGVALLYAHNGTQNAYLKLMPTGEAYIKSDKILTAAGIVTIKDSFYSSAGTYAFCGAGDESYLGIRGGDGMNSGQLILYGGSINSTSAGEARLVSHNPINGTAYNFRVTPDGKLYYKGVELRYVVEHWKSGESWYRKWSDGWIEQGGRLTCPYGGAAVMTTLHKAFTNTDYCIQVTPFLANSSAYAPTVANQTETTFSTYYLQAGAEVPAFWYACGN